MAVLIPDVMPLSIPDTTEQKQDRENYATQERGEKLELSWSSEHTQYTSTKKHQTFITP
jgi:hypothetical protein